MNRIVIDKEKKEVFDVRKNKVMINVNTDTYLFIDDNMYDHYIFNVNSSKLNVLCLFKNKIDAKFDFNLDGSNVCFNMVSYDSSSFCFNANLNNEKTDLKIYNSIISNSKNENIKININHNCSLTYSNVYNFGYTKKNGSICFDVSSKVKKGHKSCRVNQESKIIADNKTNNNVINPVLLIDEYDVEARHAAFIGEFNQDQIFYLKTRGLTNKDAKELLLDGLLFGMMAINMDEREFIKNKIKNDWR